VKTIEQIVADQWQLIDGQYVVKELILKIVNNRYLVRSALQKCIRKSKTQHALDYASYLYHFDPKKIWRDLAIIAVEDIGPAAPDAVSLALHMDKYSKDRALYREELQTLATVVAGLSMAPQKSRSCCEMSLASDLLYRRMVATTEFDLMPKDAVSEFLNNPQFLTLQPLLPLYVELLSARGKMLHHKKDTHRLEVLLGAYQENLTPELYRMAELAVDRAHDSMFCAAPVVAFAYQTAEITPVPYEVPPEKYIRGVPSSAFDMHTHPGRLAIKAFHTHLAKTDLRVAGLQTELAMKALGSIVFCIEGGVCRNQVDFLGLKAFQDKYFPLGYGIPEQSLEAFFDLVRSNFDILEQKREWSATL
jgi:hypothetical protein